MTNCETIAAYYARPGCRCCGGRAGRNGSLADSLQPTSRGHAMPLSLFLIMLRF